MASTDPSEFEHNGSMDGSCFPSEVFCLTIITIANSIMVASTKNRDTNKYDAREFNLDPDGLSA